MSDIKQRDQDWEARARELLDHHAERLDPAQTRRLHQARQRALASVRHPRLKGWAIGLSAATAACLLLLVLLPSPERSIEPRSEASTPAQITTESMEKVLALSDADLELIADPDEFALLQDLEFYAWLEGSERGG